MNSNVYATIYDLLPVSVLLIKADEKTFKVTAVNKACGLLLGMQGDQITGREFINIILSVHNTQQQQVAECLQKVCRDKQLHTIKELEYTIGSGVKAGQTKYLNILFTPVINGHGVVAQIIVTLTDITSAVAARQCEAIIQAELIESRNQYQALLQAVEGIVWEADAQTFEFTFVNNKVKSILGYSPEEWLSKPGFWKDHIYHKDREYAINSWQLYTQPPHSHTFDYRMIKADGGIVWLKDIVSVINENGKPKWLRGIMVDITATKLMAELDHLEKEVLELNSTKDTDIEIVLNYYVQGIENLFPQMRCSVLRVRNNRLYSWASSSLPEAYVGSINNLEIGPEAGSCGAAAFFKERVIVSDIENDVKWTGYKHLAMPYGLRACWSYPIIDADGIVIAVFGVYYDTIKTPDEDELAIIERSAVILKVILENRLYAAMIQETNLLTAQGQHLANFGNWQWDISNNKVSWSDALYDIYGLDENTFKATFEGYLSMLHPDDRDRVVGIIKDVLSTHKDIMFEERIIRPDGEVRHLKSWGRVILNDAGMPVKMIGACLDITKVKKTETKMEEIAWLQSHVIRAPLARLMGLVDILQNDMHPKIQHGEILTSILYSAHELDDIIRNISSKTES